MLRSMAVVLAPTLILVAALTGPATPTAAATYETVVPPPVVSVRQVCDADGRCYETGDPGYRDDDVGPPRRRYDPDDERGPPPRRRYDPDDDDRLPPPSRRRYDPDEDRPAQGRRYYRDDDN